MDRRSRFYSQTVEGSLCDGLYMVGITVNAGDSDHQVEHLADVEVAAKLTRPLRLSGGSVSPSESPRLAQALTHP